MIRVLTLIALMIGACGGEAPAMAQPTNAAAPLLKYEAPRLLTGTIYPKDP